MTADVEPPPVRETLLERAVAAHAEGQAGLAEALYRQILEGDAAHTEAGYFLGVLLLGRGDAEAGLALLKRAYDAGRFERGFDARLNAVLGALDEEPSESIRDLLRRERLVPWNIVGRLGAELDFRSVEPWHFTRRRMNLFPRRQSEFDDVPKLIESTVLKGWLPPRPPFRRDARLLTMGSCFAHELRNHLAERGIASGWLFVPSGLNNTFALRAFIDWCVTGERSGDAYWYDEHRSGGAVRWEPAEEQAYYRRMLEQIDGLVLTVGLAEVWYDTVSGGVFWRGVPKSIYDEEKHRCRMTSVAENADNLRTIRRLIRSVRPGLPIIVTLSPVPLNSTFADESCVTADCLSKSVLRVAIAELLADADPHLHYWPSFEIVRWLGAHLDHSLYGDDGNPRHVNRRAVRMILESFMTHYFDAPAG